MRILKAGLLVAVLPLVAAPAAAGTQYYVRPDGNDTQCNGRYNQPVASGPDCAFLSPQRAFDENGTPAGEYLHSESGDDLWIAAGTYGRFEIPALFRGLPNDRTIITGDPAVSRLLVKVEAQGTQEEAILIRSNKFNPTDYLTIQHLSFKAGTKHGIHAAEMIRHVAFTDLEAGPADFANLCCRTSHDDSAAVIRVGDSDNTGSTDIQVTFSRFIGPAPGPPVSGILGANASVFVLHASESRIHQVEASHFLGSFAAEISHNTIVENNTFSNSVCGDFDGCIFSYNDHDVLIRRNVLHTIRPGGQMPAIKLRRNPAETDDVEAYVYNNTLIGAPNIIDGSPNIGMNFFMPTGSSANSTRGVFLNNIVMNLGNPSGSSNYAVVLAHCPTAQREIDYNNFWNNAIDPNSGQPRNFLNSAAAPCSTETYNANSFSYNPQLNAAFQPPAGHPLCGAGSTGFTAEYDGDSSSSYVGARPCAAGGGGGGCHPFCYED